MKRASDQRAIARLQLAGSIGLVMALVAVLGFFLVRQQAGENEEALRSLEAEQIAAQESLLARQIENARSYVGYLRLRTESQLKGRIREPVDDAVDLLDAVYRRERGRLSDGALQALLLDTLRSRHFFEGRGYFFIIRQDGVAVMMPSAPDREGRNIGQGQDGRWSPVVRTILDAASRPIGEGFVSYRWYKPGVPDRLFDKLSYVRAFEPLGWVVGAGEYRQEAERDLERDMLDRLSGFGELGGITVLSDEQVVLASPVDRSLEGKPLDRLPAVARRGFETILEQAARGPGPVRYNWVRPGGSQFTPRLSYVLHLAEPGWTLAAGIYLDDIARSIALRREVLNGQLRERTRVTILVLIAGCLAAVGLQLALSRLVGRLVGQYEADLLRRDAELRRTGQQLFLVDYMVDNCGDVIFLADAAWKLVYGNRFVFEQLGWVKDEFIAGPFREVAAATAEGSAQSAESRRFEVQLETTDGRRLPVEVAIKEVLYEGRLYHFGIARDITERKRWEADLAQKAAELERSNRELEAFAYVTSHDLQEPLRTVSSYLGLLRQRHGGELSESAIEYIDIAVDGSRRMKALIGDLLTYSRLSTRGRAFRPVEMAGVIDDAIANLRTAIADCQAEITVADRLPVVIGDAGQLSMLIQNLVSNAIKYVPADRHPVIAIELDEEPGWWVFRVRDNGIGIESKYFERIFVIFQRLHGRGEYEGTGIGLAICKKVVERHGGEIAVESTPGQGSTFLFRLPRDGQAPEDQATPEE